MIHSCASQLQLRAFILAQQVCVCLHAWTFMYICVVFKLHLYVRAMCMNVSCVFMHPQVFVCVCVCLWCCRCTGYSRCPCGLSALFRLCGQVQPLTPSFRTLIFQPQLHFNNTDALNLKKSKPGYWVYVLSNVFSFFFLFFFSPHILNLHSASVGETFAKQYQKNSSQNWATK